MNLDSLSRAIDGLRRTGGKRRHAPTTRVRFAPPWDPKARGGRGGWRPFIPRTMGRSGAYAIRKTSGEVLYVGSSNAGRLYRTMLRHLEEWNRDKVFWSDVMDRSHGAPGETFDREQVDVAVRLCPASKAREVESDLIRQLRPVHNEMAPEGQEPVPF